MQKCSYLWLVVTRFSSPVYLSSIILTNSFKWALIMCSVIDVSFHYKCSSDCLDAKPQEWSSCSFCFFSNFYCFRRRIWLKKDFIEEARWPIFRGRPRNSFLLWILNFYLKSSFLHPCIIGIENVWVYYVTSSGSYWVYGALTQPSQL